MSSNSFDIFDPMFANATGRKVITKKSGEENLRNCKHAHKEFIELTIPPAPLQEPASSSRQNSWSPSDDHHLSAPLPPAPAAGRQGHITPTPALVRILPKFATRTPAGPPNNGEIHDFSVRRRVPSLRTPNVHEVPLKTPPRDLAENGLSVSSNSTENMVSKRPKKYAEYGGIRFEIVGDDDSPSPTHPSPITKKANGALKRRTRIRPLGATTPHVDEMRRERMEPTPFAALKQREWESARLAGVPEQYRVPKDWERIWKWLDGVEEESGNMEIVMERESGERMEE